MKRLLLFPLLALVLFAQTPPPAPSVSAFAWTMSPNSSIFAGLPVKPAIGPICFVFSSLSNPAPGTKYVFTIEVDLVSGPPILTSYSDYSGPGWVISEVQLQPNQVVSGVKVSLFGSAATSSATLLAP